MRNAFIGYHISSSGAITPTTSNSNGSYTFDTYTHSDRSTLIARIPKVEVISGHLYNQITLTCDDNDNNGFTVYWNVSEPIAFRIKLVSLYAVSI